MAVYDEIEIEDMDWKADERVFYYPCPCGDKFSITLVRCLRAFSPSIKIQAERPLLCRMSC
jgi:hypothetical protein